MPRCIAFQNKTSDLQCSSHSLFGHSLCGRHSKAKSPKLWVPRESPDTRAARKIQSIVRGWFIRKYLRNCGPGVLHRVDLANEEDVITYEVANRVSPLNYFAFVENGRTWWFDFSSIWHWGTKSLEPHNPYTRVPLSTDTRKRLREMWFLRKARGLPIPDNDESNLERLKTRTNTVCQVFVDNGFTEINPEHFARLTKQDYVALFYMIRSDIPTSFSKHNRGGEIALIMCSYMLSPKSLAMSEPLYRLTAVRVLLRIMTAHKDPYVLVFIVLSALFRC